MTETYRAAKVGADGPNENVYLQSCLFFGAAV